MRQAKHVKARKSHAGFYSILFALLFLVILGIILISQNTGKNDLLAPAQGEPAGTALENNLQKDSETAGSPSSTTNAETGALLESGSNINANFYSVFDYDGAVSDLTDASFYVGKAGMTFDNKGQLILPAVTVFYSEDTVVKTAILYNNDDRYEIYSSSLDDFKKQMEEKELLDSVLIVLEDPDAEELWAKEITIYCFADLG